MAHLSDLIVNGSARIINSLVANTLAGNGASITSLNASNINSGKLGLAYLTTATTAKSFLYVASANGTPTWTTVDNSTVGLGNVTNNKQIKGLASGTTSGHIVTWGSDGYTVADSGYTISTAFSSTPSSTALPTENAIKNYLGTYFAANDAMVFKGTIATSGGTVSSLPNTTASAGWTYRAKEAGYIYTDGTFVTTADTSKTLIGRVEIGDMIICITDGSTSTAATWSIVQTNIDGAVVGPASATTHHIATYADTTGKLLEDSYSISSSVTNGATTTVPTSDAVYDYATSTYLPLAGGTMTGTIKRSYASASTSPALTVVSSNLDVTLLRVTSGEYSDKTSSGYGYNLKYIGTGSNAANLLTQYCDNQASTEVIGWSLNQSGQMGIGTTPNTSYQLYSNGNTYINGTLTASSTITGNLTGNVTGNITGSKTGGVAGQLLYQSAANTTSFLAAPAANQVLVATTASTPVWGTVTNAMLAGSIANNKLVNSSVTIGTTEISLGSSSTTLAGLTSVKSTSFSGQIEPITVKTYTDSSYYGSGDNNTSNCFYFLYVKPDEWYKPWHIKVKFTTTCAANTSYYSVTWCDLYGRADGITYHNFNEIYNTAHYYVCVHRINSTGFGNNYRHAVGINIRYSNNYTSSSYPRTFKVEYYGCDGCTVSLLDTPLKYNSLEGYDSSKTNRISTDGCSDNCDACNRGLRESGDDNSYATVVDESYQVRKAGTNGLFSRNICTVDENDCLQSLTLTAGSTGTTHTVNTAKFKIGAPFWWNTSWTTWSNGNVVSAGTLREIDSLIDFRYSSNCGTTLTKNLPVYLVGTPDSTNPSLYTLNSTWYTQTLPTSDDGYIYIYMGVAYQDSNPYRISWNVFHDIYWYKNGHLQPYFNANYIPTGTITNDHLAGSIINSKLTNSSITVGTTEISLGNSSTTLAGLTSVTSTSFTGALTGNASTASKINTSKAIGSSTQPVYIASDGTVTAATAYSSASVSSATTATNLAGGTAGKIPYQTAASTTSFIGAPSANQVLVATAANTPTWGTVTNDMLAGSIANTKLVNDSVTIGTTEINLGSSSTSLAGVSGLTMTNTGVISWADSGSWNYTSDKTGYSGVGVIGGLSWTGQSDGITLKASETARDNLELILKFTDDNSNGLTIQNNSGTQTARITAGGAISGTSFSGPLTGNVTGNVTGNITGNITGNKTGGSAGQLLYQSAADTTSFLTAPKANQVLVATADNTPVWSTVTNDMLAGNIANAKLVNDYVTIGTTSISLGSSSKTLAGLTSVTATTFNGALSGNASTATLLASHSSSITGAAGSWAGPTAVSSFKYDAGYAYRQKYQISGNSDTADWGIALSATSTSALIASIYCDGGFYTIGSMGASGTITAGGFSGPITGNVTGNITGNITGSKTGGSAGQLLYQSAENTTSFLTAPATNQVLVATAANTPKWATVDTAMITDEAVTDGKLASNAVTTVKIKDANVTTAKIADLNVTEGKIAASAVTTGKIKDANVTTAKIADSNVTTAKIADSNVTTAKLASNAVTTVKITDANVTEAKLATDSVTTAKIKDANVTNAKLASDSVTTAKIKDGEVTNAKLKNSSFTLGQTSVSLGDTKTTIAGFENVSSKKFSLSVDGSTTGATKIEKAYMVYNSSTESIDFAFV